MSTSASPLSWVDKLLSVWILLAIGAGFGLSFVPGFSTTFDEKVSVSGTNILLAVGLIVMMIPPLMRVDYSRFKDILTERPAAIIFSFILNYIVGPFLMFGLGFIFTRGVCTAPSDCYALMQGIVLIGVARCIAMVLVWNQYAQGDNNFCAVLVACNSAAQLVLFALYAFLFNDVLLPLVWNGEALDGSPIEPATDFNELVPNLVESLKEVAIYLGIPFGLALLAYFTARPIMGKTAYTRLCDLISPLTLVSLLFTIVILFGIRGEDILASPLDVVYVALPLILYFIIMFNVAFIGSWALGMNYAYSSTIAFTAAGNNFEVALAVAIARYTATSKQAFAAVVGPLIEIPIMLLLIWMSFTYRRILYYEDRCIECPQGTEECPAKVYNKRNLLRKRTVRYTDEVQPELELTPS